ncbi:MAG TPA: hypothetical protein VF331_11715 [Polyangiales bacterium]
MNTNKRIEYVTRDQIMKTLSDAEVASVSTAETALHLADGEEFLDLAQLGKGVQRAVATTATGRVLPKKAVHEKTWTKILTNLTTAHARTS